MIEDWRTILVAIATILSILANAGVVKTGTAVTTLEKRTNAHSLGRKERFARIERQLTVIQDRLGDY